MSEVYISSIIFIFLGFVFHYLQKICDKDYKKAKDEFEIFLKLNNTSEWDYNFKKYKMDMSNMRKWSAFLFKYLCFISSILVFISALTK